MNWDYDKLFADGNVIGVYHYNLGVIVTHIIGEYMGYDWDTCKHLGLSDIVYRIEYIVRLDNHGNVAEHLFDRDRDMPKPMPELTAGTFGEAVWFDESGFDIETNEKFVIIGNGTVIYADGDYDDFESLNTNTVKGYCGYVITKVYSTFCRKFAECTSERIVWNNPEYVKWLDKQIKE